ncbi:MAG: DUF11 domain-containing protein, partial [Deltaproteobacteria bacterium]|nr:DUF11 domain-containing protein [Candidatus Tharpella sp.]
MEQNKIHKLIRILIIICFLSLSWASVSIAALQLAFTQEALSLSIGEEGTWEVTATNPDPAAVNNATLTVTLMPDFTVTDPGGGTESAGPPHTLTWAGINLPANGGLRVVSYKARPNCGANSKEPMAAVITYGSGLSDTADSKSIKVETPVVSVSLVDANGNTVADASIGDVITWTLTIDNTGNGNVAAGADIKLDASLNSFTISSPTGHALPGSIIPGTPIIWNSGLINAHVYAEYTIDLTVTVCSRDDEDNGVEVNWSDGNGTPCLSSPIIANASINLKINEPKISIDVTDPGPLGYCPGSKTTAQIKITNSGTGPAENFLLMMDNWPATWQVTPITPGLTFDDNINIFEIADIPAGDSLTFEFDIEPGSGCPVTDSATLLFLPFYTNQCGKIYGTTYYTPVVGPQTWTMAIPAPPTFTVVKIGPSDADVGETGLTYTIRTTYTGPDLASPYATDIIDHYPPEFDLTNDGGGSVDSSQHTITWPAQFQNSGDFIEHTIVMDVPNDPCLGFHSYCNRATVSSVPDDCQGCPGVIDPGEVCTFIHDTHGNVISATSLVQLTPNPADVCSNLQFKTCYIFDSGAPTIWDGIILGNEMSVPGDFTFDSIDKIEVDGTDYTNNFPNPTFPLDLSVLTSIAPDPDTGAEICVTYTYSVQNSEGDFRNISSLKVPSGESGCVKSQDYNVAADFSVEGSRMEVTAGGTPDLINTCETLEFTIEIGGFRTLYDATITLDTENNYIYESTVSFSDIKDAAGNDITTIFEPTDNGDGTYTWDFRTHATNGDILPQGTITFKMQHSCDPNRIEWSETGAYNNKCEDGNDGEGTNDPQKRTAQRSTDAPLKILDGEPTLHLTPPKVFSITPYPKQTITIVNGGSGPLYNVALTVSLDLDLIYLSSSVPSGSSGPDSIDVPDSHTVVLHYDKIASGDAESLDMVLKLIGCTQLNINASLTWCDPDPNKSCDNVAQTSVVTLPNSQVLVVNHTGDKLDYCNDQPATFNIKMQNSAQADAYNTRIVELLPPGVTYDSTTVFSHVNGYGNLSNPPTITTSTIGSGSTAREEITWDFSSVLPLNNNSPQAPAMAPSSVLDVIFQVQIADCDAAADFAASNKEASATAIFDPPCNFEGTHPATVSTAKILATTPFRPRVTIRKEGINLTKGSAWSEIKVLADPGDMIAWRITYISNGDYLAKAVEIKDDLPGNVTYLAGSGKLDGTSGLPNDWFSAGYDLSDMLPGTSHTVYYETEIKAPGGCTTIPTENIAHAKFGCCSSPAMQEISDQVSLYTSPDFHDADGTIQISHANWTKCGGEVIVTITNSGGTATNDKIVVTLDSHYIADSTGPCSTTSSDSSHSGLLCPTLSGDTITWNHSEIDYVAPSETITIRFWAKTANTGDCSGSIGNITNKVDFDYLNACSSVIKTVSDEDTFTPPQPNLAISIAPTQQIVNEGDPATWTITLTNSGNAAAENLVLTDILGDGFSSPSDTQNGSWVGNTVTWNPGPIAAGGSWQATVTATANSGSLSNHANVVGKCQNHTDTDTCTYVDKDADAYVAAFSLDKSVTPTIANVGELLTYRVTAVFSNTDTFQNAKVIDSLPPWVEYVASQPFPGGN